MIHKFQSLMLSLAILAVGAAQVLGIQAGYVCACTGQASQMETCRQDACHPGHNHASQGELEESCDCEGDDHPSPSDRDHKHRQVHEPLIITGFPPQVQLPALVLFDLPEAFFQTALLTAILQELPILRPAHYARPPTPVLVARTMVMLV